MVEIWPSVMAHASGGLWLPNVQTLALADLHLGYGWAQRRRGTLGALADEETERRLDQVLNELCPRKLILMGDIVHAARPGLREKDLIERVLLSLAKRTELSCLRGNHDRQFARDFDRLGIQLQDESVFDGLTFRHGDRLPATLYPEQRLVVGHLHPAIGIKDAAGVRQRVPAFVLAGPVVVVPAFSPFAAGLDVWRSIPLEIGQLAGHAAPEVIAATGSRVVKLGPLRRLVSPAKGTAPRDYRGSK